MNGMVCELYLSEIATKNNIVIVEHLANAER